MLQYKWTSTTITTNKQANDMVTLFKTLCPNVGAIDTETDGLNIVLNKPFLVQFGFIHPTERIGYTYAVDLERTPILARQTLQAWNRLAQTLEKYLGHNVKFDLHMMENVDLAYETENLSDTMFYIRYGSDAVQTSKGGAPLKLKEFTTRYIDHTAKRHEHLLNVEKSSIAGGINAKLRMRLQHCGRPPEQYKAASYTLRVIQDIFKDSLIEPQDLPEAIREPYLDWLSQDVPLYLQEKIVGLVQPDMIGYNTLNRENITTYAHYDIIYTIEAFLLMEPIVIARGNLAGVEFENNLILPLAQMERVGFQIDKRYLAESKLRVRNYILRRRNDMANMVSDRVFTIGQHAVIKEILSENFGVNVISTGAEELDLLKSNLIIQGGHQQAVDFITVVQELRTLEKWYSTYILRFEYNLKHHPRLYPTINQVQPVSGRVSSDFQQFPKGAIKDIDGNELFHPRKMVVVTTGGNYDSIIYLDYSQIELRFQAFYTILCGRPDPNLCRAYMPYDCKDENGKLFDYRDYHDIKRWDKDWRLAEDISQKWTPTDVHGATTKAAFGITEAHEDYHDLRYIGKRVNFAKNYGAQRGKIRIMFPHFSEEQITKIDEAYYLAFPGIKEYHKYCAARSDYAYTENLFGVRYYGVSGHNLKNMLVQGSAAFFLKLKIRQIYDWCKSNGIKSRLQMQIHDELSWEKHTLDSPAIFFKLKETMEDWTDSFVPIVADMEVTTTNWAEKKGVNTIEELQMRIGS